MVVIQFYSRVFIFGVLGDLLDVGPLDQSPFTVVTF